MIQLQNIHKSYNQQEVVSIPSFTFEKQIYWLKGINGSGKTTLLKIIAGLLPFEGDVVIEGKISLKKNRTEYLRLVNYVEAEPLYPSFLTGLDLLQFYKRTKGGNKEQSDRLIELLQVSSFIGNPVGTYSSGMLKKISLLLAFTGQPCFILLDEPLVTIDDSTVPVVNTIIRDYHEKQGIIFLLTSHQLFETDAFHITHQLKMNHQTIHPL